MPIIIPVGGSGGATLDITAYAAVGNLPASDKEGAVAVITATAVSDVYASADQPASPSSGDVWVWIGGKSLAPIALTDSFTLHPIAIYQYGGSGWVLKKSYVYTNSAWVEVTLDLYNAGTYFLGGSLSTVAARYAPNSFVTDGATSIYLYADKTNTFTYIYAGFDNAIDLSNVSAIKITFDQTISSDAGAIILGISADKSMTLTASASSTGTGTNKTLLLDVSAISGAYYVILEAFATVSDHSEAAGYIKKVELIR